MWKVSHKKLVKEQYLKSFTKPTKHIAKQQHELQCCINTCSSLMEYSIAD